MASFHNVAKVSQIEETHEAQQGCESDLTESVEERMHGGHSRRESGEHPSLQTKVDEKGWVRTGRLAKHFSRDTAGKYKVRDRNRERADDTT